MDFPLYSTKINVVYSDLNITGDSYVKNGIKYQFTDIKQPEAIFNAVEQKNMIISTSIVGSPSDIIEYTGENNWKIGVEMVINGEYLTFPMATVKNIMTMLGSNQVLAINSWYLNNILDIWNVIIVSKGMPQRRGDLNNVSIKFEMLAVDPFLLSNLLNNSNAAPVTIPNNLIA